MTNRFFFIYSIDEIPFNFLDIGLIKKCEELFYYLTFLGKKNKTK